MKIFKIIQPDNQRRVNLNVFFGPEADVVFYMEFGSDFIYIEEYDENDMWAPKYAARRTDKKGRVVLPDWMMRRGYKLFYATVDCYEKDTGAVRRVVLIPDTA